MIKKKGHDKSIDWYMLGVLIYELLIYHMKIHQFAKQQDKWFRNIEKKGITINWVDIEGPVLDTSKELIDQFLNKV